MSFTPNLTPEQVQELDERRKHGDIGRINEPNRSVLQGKEKSMNYDKMLKGLVSTRKGTQLLKGFAGGPTAGMAAPHMNPPDPVTTSPQAPTMKSTEEETGDFKAKTPGQKIADYAARGVGHALGGTQKLLFGLTKPY